jgi:hypothetical protein
MKPLIIAAVLLALLSPAHAFTSYVCGKDVMVTYTGTSHTRLVITADGAGIKNVYRLKQIPDKEDGTALLLNGKRCKRD